MAVSNKRGSYSRSVSDKYRIIIQEIKPDGQSELLSQLKEKLANFLIPACPVHQLTAGPVAVLLWENLILNWKSKLPFRPKYTALKIHSGKLDTGLGSWCFWIWNFISILELWTNDWEENNTDTQHPICMQCCCALPFLNLIAWVKVRRIKSRRPVCFFLTEGRNPASFRRQM